MAICNYGIMILFLLHILWYIFVYLYNSIHLYVDFCKLMCWVNVGSKVWSIRRCFFSPGIRKYNIGLDDFLYE